MFTSIVNSPDYSDSLTYSLVMVVTDGFSSTPSTIKTFKIAPPDYSNGFSLAENGVTVLKTLQIQGG